MVVVTIKFFAAIREITGKKEVSLQLEESEATVRDALDRLSKEYGKAFKQYVFSAGGRKSLRPQVSVMVNGQSIRNLENLETRIRDGDTIAILPPISGG